MTELLRDPTAIQVLVLLVLLPVVVIGAGEVEERLRQRDSAFRPVVTTLRWWTIPLLALWFLLVSVANLSETRLLVRLVATALLVSLAGVGLAATRLVIARLKRQREVGAGRRLPQIVLALPRIVIILVIAWLLIDGVWGVDLSAALTALGVGTLVVSLALQDTLSGLASGLLLLGDAPFAPGDWIRHGELDGRVVDINWRSTRIRSRDGDLVIVPNAELAGAMLINFDRPSRVHRVVVPVQVAYVNPPTNAKAMLLDAARGTPGVLADPPPNVRVVQIDDPLMGYEVDLWIDDFAIAPRVSSDFGSLVWYQSHRHDVPLPSPAYDLYVYDGVAAGEADQVGEDEVRQRLRASPLLDRIDDGDLDRLTAAATAARFAKHETIVSADTAGADLHVLWSGRARLVADVADGGTVEVGQLRSGDLFGLLGRRGGVAAAPRIEAVTDCEVVVVEGGPAAEVISRNPALSEAVEQILSGQQKRIERVALAANGQRSAATDGGAPNATDGDAPNTTGDGAPGETDGDAPNTTDGDAPNETGGSTAAVERP